MDVLDVIIHICITKENRQYNIHRSCTAFCLYILGCRPAFAKVPLLWQKLALCNFFFLFIRRQCNFITTAMYTHTHTHTHIYIDSVTTAGDALSNKDTCAYALDIMYATMAATFNNTVIIQGFQLPYTPLQAKANCRCRMPLRLFTVISSKIYQLQYTACKISHQQWCSNNTPRPSERATALLPLPVHTLMLWPQTKCKNA